MIKSKLTPFTLVGITVLAGCSIKSGFETTPVDVQTSKGIVTCQLYTGERVLWDEAITMASSMGTEEANDVCRIEGQRRLDNSQ